MWLILSQRHELYKVALHMTENKFRWWTGCQGTLSKIYARTEKLLLGPETEVTSNYNPNKLFLHKYLDVVAVKYVQDIQIHVCKRNQSKKALKIHPICLTESDHNYILEEIQHRYIIDYIINIRSDGDA